MAVLLLAALGGAAAQDGEPVSIIFMHHSTGLGVIQQGGVREAFTDLGYAFWDHGYNDEGLVDPAGDYLGINWDRRHEELFRTLANHPWMEVYGPFFCPTIRSNTT